MSDFDDRPGAAPGRDPSSAAADKRELRRRVLAARRARPAEEIHRLDTDLQGVTGGWLDRHPRGTVAGYVPMPGEPGGPGLPAALARHTGRLILPVLRPDNDLDWALYQGELAAAGRGLAEPPGPRLGVDAIIAATVVIVPALAVDGAGMRLGRGGGSYDRALARIDPHTTVLALLYPGELVDEVPALAHDRPVHGVVTAGRVRLL